MRIKHSVFAHHVLVDTYSKVRFERYDGQYILYLQWGINGLFVSTSFRSVKSLRRFVLSLPDGRAKRVFFDRVYYIDCFSPVPYDDFFG